MVHFHGPDKNKQNWEIFFVICCLVEGKTYLKCAVFDITFGQIATMDSVVKSECRNMRCGEATLLAQEFFHRGMYY